MTEFFFSIPEKWIFFFDLQNFKLFHAIWRNFFHFRKRKLFFDLLLFLFHGMFYKWKHIYFINSTNLKDRTPHLKPAWGCWYEWISTSSSLRKLWVFNVTEDQDGRVVAVIAVPWQVKCHIVDDIAIKTYNCEKNSSNSNHKISRQI